MESRNESTKVSTAEPFSARRCQIFGHRITDLLTNTYGVMGFLEIGR